MSASLPEQSAASPAAGGGASHAISVGGAAGTPGSPAGTAPLVATSPAASATSNTIPSAVSVGVAVRMPLSSSGAMVPAVAPATVDSGSPAVWVGGATREPVSSPPPAASAEESVSTPEPGGTAYLAMSADGTTGAPASATRDKVPAAITAVVVADTGDWAEEKWLFGDGYNLIGRRWLQLDQQHLRRKGRTGRWEQNRTKSQQNDNQSAATPSFQTSLGVHV